MKFLQMAAQPFGMLTGRSNIIMMNGRPYMLQYCAGNDVYCNALEGEDFLSEGADGPAAWPAPVIVDPTSTEPWLIDVGNGIYT